MIINTRQELDALLECCKAKPHGEIKNGGDFYTIKSQQFLFPNRTLQTREYIDKKKATIIVPITDCGNVVLVVQTVALSKEGALLEFPAGYWELGEKSEEAGIRELAEETGYVPNKLIFLGNHYQDPGSIRQEVEVFLALGCQKKYEQKLDKGEFMKGIEVPYSLVFEFIDDGYLKDANSYIGFQKACRYIEKNYKQERPFIKIKK